MKKATQAVIEAAGILITALVALVMAFLLEAKASSAPAPAEEEEEETPAQKKKRLAREKAAPAEEEEEETPAQKKKRLAKEKAAKADVDDELETTVVDGTKGDEDDDEEMLATLRKIAKPLVKDGHTSEIKDILEPYDAETLTELDSKHYAKVLKRLKALAVRLADD